MQTPSTIKNVILSDLCRSVRHQEDPGGEGDKDEGDDGDEALIDDDADDDGD